VTPLPADFLEALAAHGELLVSSRDAGGIGSVPVWYTIAPTGAVYLFGFAHSRKALRWRDDPWVRLRIPGTDIAVEGVTHFVEGAELDAVAPLIVERWDMAGATTEEGLRRLVESGSHVVVRVEGSDAR